MATAVDFTFSPGDTQLEVPVQIIEDVVLEKTEDFYATVRAFDSRVSIFQETATIRIEDDDGNRHCSQL